MQIKIPDQTPEQEQLFRYYLHVRQALGLSWDNEQQLAADILESAGKFNLTPRQIETLKDLVRSPLEQLCDSTNSVNGT